MHEDKKTITWSGLREEPYRLLFPLGLACAAVGMGLWIPYYLWPRAFPYPGQGHAVIQIQGFLLCFIFGFLATMLPKVLGLRPIGSAQLAIFPLGLAGIVAASLAGAPASAQALHLLLLGNFLFFVGTRFPARKADPPANFAFIAVALLADAAGTIVKLLALRGILGAVALRAGSLLQYQAFPLLLILGVGGFLLPKLFAQQQVNPQALMASSRLGKAGPWILAALFIASYAVEIAGLALGGGDASLRAAYALRAGVWAWFILAEVRVHKVAGKLPPYLMGARISLIVTGAGLLMPVIRPAHLLAWEHVIFLSGFLRLTLSVASRVLAAHGGRLDILLLHRRKVRVYGMLIVFAMITRIATELWPAGHWLHLAVSACFGLAALAIWARIYFPLLAAYPTR